MEVFNPEKYKKQIEESLKRKQIAFSFREPDCVPINISAGGSYFAKLFGYNIKDYYTDREIMIDVQLKSLTWRFEYLKDDRTDCALFLDIGPVAEGLFFNCPVEYPHDTSPRVVPILKDEDDIVKLEIPEPSDHPKIQWLFNEVERTERMLEKKGINLPFSFDFGIHPPLSAACAIMEPATVYTMMYENPAAIKILFEKMQDAFFRIRDYMDRRLGIKDRQEIGLANDNSAFISNKMYCEMVLPYDKAIYERYGKKGRYLHADGPNDHNFRTFADELHLTFMDIGGFSSIEAAVRDMKGKVVIHGGLNNKDLYQGLTDTAKKKIRDAIRIAAPGGGYEFAIGGETYPGVLPDTLIEMVKYVRRVGRYPIDI